MCQYSPRQLSLMAAVWLILTLTMSLTSDKPLPTPYTGTGHTRLGLWDFEVGIFSDLGWTINNPAVVHASGYDGPYGDGSSWHNGSSWNEGLPPTDGVIDNVVLGDTGNPYMISLKKPAVTEYLTVDGALAAQAELEVLSSLRVLRSNFFIGDSLGSAGRVTVTEAGYLDTSSAKIGVQQGSNGTVVVSGDDARWECRGLDVGELGHALLQIDDGATVNNAWIDVGLNGVISITDPGSTLQSTSSIWMDGVLSLSNGAKLSNISLTASIDLIVDSEGFDKGIVTVSGIGSELEANGFYVAHNLNGALEVRDRGNVITNRSYIASGVGGSASALVDGNGASWTTARILQVGAYWWESLNPSPTAADLDRGTALLTVTTGGYVSAESIIVGFHGTLAGDGVLEVADMESVRNWGTIEPGSGNDTGTLQFIGNYIQEANGRLEIEIASPLHIDQFDVTGDIHLDGVLNVHILGSYAPQVGSSFTVLIFGGSRVSTFSDLAFPTIDGIGFGLSYETGSVVLDTYMAGDLNGDGFVGIADLNIVLGDWNSTTFAGDWSAGDLSGDGFIGIEDLNLVLGNWNAGTPPASPAPEPTTAALMLAGVAALTRRMRGGWPC